MTSLFGKYMTEQIAAVVIDNGEYSCKGGLSGAETPNCEIRTVISRKNGVHVGDECSSINPLKLKYPIERGQVTSWDDMEKVWNYIFHNKLNVDPAEHPVLLTEPSKRPRFVREKMIEIMFETFKVPSYYANFQAIFSLYASASSTGLVAQLGHGVTEIIPVYEYYGIERPSLHYSFSGCEVDAFLQKILEIDHSLTDEAYCSSSTKKEVLHDIKEKHCYVALDYDAEMQKPKSSNVSYTLPDGQSIKLADERFRVPELLFKPHMNGFEFDGIDQTIFDSIMKCDIDVRKDLYANIVLSGGTTMFEGLPERIEKEIIRLAPPTMKTKVIAPPERKYASWIGGSILASLATFPQMVITHDEYNDAGPGIVHRKCF